MEAIIPVWLGEFAKQGFGYVLFGLSCWVIRWQNKMLLDYGKAVTEALTRATDQNRELLTVQRERVESDKSSATAMQLLVKQIENSDALARERADDIRRTIREGRAK